MTEPTTASPLPADRMRQPCLQLDLTASNPRLVDLDVANPTVFSAWIDDEIARSGCAWAVGGYAEDRAVYGMSPLFGGDANPRSVHLGVDLWMQAGTPVQAVAGGIVHSTADNAHFGDYGPTIVVEHHMDRERQYVLYGHLARRSLTNVRAGTAVRAGQTIGWLGAPDENLGWPPHLHLQLIRAMGERRGDYPGVCAAGEQDRWLQDSPDPAPLIAPWLGEIRALPGRVAASL